MGRKYKQPRLQHALIETFNFAKQVYRVKGEIRFLTYHSAVECADHTSSHYYTPQIKSRDCRRKENACITVKYIPVLLKKSSAGSYIIYWAPTSIPSYPKLGPNLKKCTKTNRAEILFDELNRPGVYPQTLYRIQHWLHHIHEKAFVL